MIDTIIVSGGNIHSDFALDFLKKRIKEGGRESLALVAADSGMEWFMRNREFIPDLAVGDFDSLSEEGRGFLEIHEKGSGNGEIPYGGMMGWKVQKSFRDEAKEITVIRLRPEKDDSDTQSAMNYAIQNGAKRITILGATGNRVDHLMANFGLLVLAKKQETEVILADQYNYMKLVSDGEIIKKSEQFGKYVSLIPYTAQVEHLYLAGFKYPLADYCLKGFCSIGVSNEITEEQAEITWDYVHFIKKNPVHSAYHQISKYSTALDAE